MPIVNIIDGRKRPYRFLKINAVVEAAWHDNSCKDADTIYGGGGPDYEEQEHVTLGEAVRWAQSFQNAVTLYIYDEDGGIYYTKEGERQLTSHLRDFVEEEKAR